MKMVLSQPAHSSADEASVPLVSQYWFCSNDQEQAAILGTVPIIRSIPGQHNGPWEWANAQYELTNVLYRELALTIHQLAATVEGTV